MHEQILAFAAWPLPRSVLKVRLRPYSIGHELILWRCGNPLVILSQDEFNALQWQDKKSALIEAVEYCSRDWKSRDEQAKNFKKWSKLFEGCDFEDEIKQFRIYQLEGQLCFPSDIPTKEGTAQRYIGAPGLVRLYCFICARVPECEILMYGSSGFDFPLGLARMMSQSEDEMEGRIEIYNHRHKVHDDFVAQCEAEDAAKNKE